MANVLCNQRNGLGTAWACGLVAWLAFGLSGCTQQFYRIQADKEVKYLVTQKSNDPRWQYDSFTIGMDPRSRYFDPDRSRRPADALRRSGRALATCIASPARRAIPAGT